ncbi:hypothetical protein CLU79DRAFT_573810 [Phycomyces nitens]|nr:hypothetical protein CLU79DRAFT_573810 [Phycomyces nitens]
MPKKISRISELPPHSFQIFRERENSQPAEELNTRNVLERFLDKIKAIKFKNSLKKFDESEQTDVCREDQEIHIRDIPCTQRLCSQRFRNQQTLKNHLKYCTQFSSS